VFDRVLAGLDQAPLTVTGTRRPRPPVNQGVASWAILNVLYQSELWPALTSAIAEAQRGNGRALLDLYDSYVTVGGQYPHVFDALIAINCVDDASEFSQAEYDALDAEMKAIAPRMGPYMMGQPFCLDWPAEGPAPVAVTGKGAGPVVVVGTTGDPVTPLESSANMAEALEGGILVTADATQHTGYQTSDCIDEAIERYLVELVVPRAGLVCRAD
jgi:pimeloyl-ACP methyl ester carboxylesterase